MRLLDLSFNKIQNASALDKCKNLEKLELQGNKISDFKNLPLGLQNLRTVYFQEFEMHSGNPICNMAGYDEKIYKIFTGLLALDGYRKSVKMDCNMKEALPEEPALKFEYDTSGK